MSSKAYRIFPSYNIFFDKNISIFGKVNNALKFQYIFILGNTISENVYDIEVLMYPSCNISKNEFDKQKAFVKALTASITSSPNVSESGVIAYMMEMNRDYRTKRTDHTDISSFNQAVNNIPLMDYMHRTNWALRYAWRKILNRVSGTSQTQKSVVLLVTDGFQRGNRDSENPEDVAAQMRQDDINIVAIAIGQNVNFTILQSFTGNIALVIPLPEFNVATFPTFDRIAGLGNPIFDLFCFNFSFLYRLKMSVN